MATTRFDFPRNFLWGTATAAHQVEGNNVNNDFWILEHTPGSPFIEPSGDACDQYHRYADDIAMAEFIACAAVDEIEPEAVGKIDIFRPETRRVRTEVEVHRLVGIWHHHFERERRARRG